MLEREPLRETIKAYRNGEFDKDRTGSDAKVKDLWWDWFCKDSSLGNKGRSLLQKLNQRTAKKLTRTIPTFGSRTTAPATATFTTVCQSARLEQNALFIALFRSQDINATTAKPSCMAQRTILKLRLSKERGKTLKTGSATKRNNRLPEKAGGFFGEYNAAAYYCTLLINVSRCGRILTDVASVCRFLIQTTTKRNPGRKFYRGGFHLRQ